MSYDMCFSNMYVSNHFVTFKIQCTIFKQAMSRTYIIECSIEMISS